MDINHVKDTFIYDEEDGALLWRKDRFGGRYGNSIVAKAGSVAGSVSSNGYRTVLFDGKRVLVHRLIWLYVTGLMPTKQIDHIDGDRSNNKFGNLREVSCAENSQNRHACSSSTGVLGVFVSPRTKKPYRSRIMVNGEEHSLGRFNSVEEASEAYIKAKKKLHPAYVP